MIKMNVKGIMLTGFAAYLIVAKGLNTIGRIADKVCEASKWKSYYRYGKDGTMVPPGYYSYTRPIGENTEQVVEKNNPGNASQEGLGKAIVDAAVDAIRNKTKGTEAPEEAVEGEREASEEDKDIPNDYVAFMRYVNECEAKGMSEKEIALSLGMSVEKLRENFEEADRRAQDLDAEDTFYVDDLVDGVKTQDTDGDDIHE